MPQRPSVQALEIIIINRPPSLPLSIRDLGWCRGKCMPHSLLSQRNFPTNKGVLVAPNIRCLLDNSSQSCPFSKSQVSNPCLPAAAETRCQYIMYPFTLFSDSKVFISWQLMPLKTVIILLILLAVGIILPFYLLNNLAGSCCTLELYPELSRFLSPAEFFHLIYLILFINSKFRLVWFIITYGLLAFELSINNATIY